MVRVSSIFPCPGAIGWLRQVEPCDFSSEGSLGTSECIEDLFGGRSCLGDLPGAALYSARTEAWGLQ